MGGEAQSKCVQLVIMSSLVPCLHEEADTSMFAHAMEAAKKPSKKISSCTIDIDVVVLVIPVVQQLGVDELRC